MHPNLLKFLRVGLAALALIGILVSCNSHLLLAVGGDGTAGVVDPLTTLPPPVALSDAGLPTSVFDPVTLGPLPDGGLPDAVVGKTPDAKIPDAAPPPRTWPVPPDKFVFTCATFGRRG